MILYRIQLTTSDGWLIEWAPTLEDAEEAADAFRDAEPRGLRGGVFLDAVEIPALDEVTLTEALNKAHMNRVNWPGEEVKR